jgi:Holliday junction resolvase RusA-like endonuclease
MQKSSKLKFRLPEYVNPRNAWRKKIYASALAAVKKQGVSYPEDAKLSVEVRLYLRGRALEIHDLDNRLKDILDALQGRMGGSKAVRKFVPIIQNYRQVFHVIISKLSPQGQSHGLGHVTVKRIR